MNRRTKLNPDPIIGMSAQQIRDFFSNIADRCITVCHSCSEKGVVQRKRSADLGYCFYRPHEKVYANETGILLLSWGSYSPDELSIHVVANAILDEASSCKLNASWSGSMSDRIVIRDLDPLYFD